MRITGLCRGTAPTTRNAAGGVMAVLSGVVLCALLAAGITGRCLCVQLGSAAAVARFVADIGPG